MRIFGCIIGILLIASCVNKDNAPSGILSRDSMKNIMWDMIQADQYSKQFLQKDSAKINVRQETLKLYQQIFDLHHVTKDEFNKSYQYYLTRPDLNKMIFDSLSAEIVRERHQSYISPKAKPILKQIK